MIGRNKHRRRRLAGKSIGEKHLGPALARLAKRQQSGLHVRVVKRGGGDGLQRLTLGRRHGVADEDVQAVRLGAEINEANIAHVKPAGQRLDREQAGQQDTESL